MKCDVCGIESEAKQWFTTQRLSFRRSKRTYCKDCWKLYFTSSQRWEWYFVALLLILPSIVMWLIMLGTDSPFSPTDVVAVFIIQIKTIALYIGATILMILAHEFGHAVAGKLVGAKLFSIIIGYGKPLFRFKYMSVHFIVNRFPFSGFCISIVPNLSLYRLRRIILLSAGIAVNLAFALVGFYLLQHKEPINDIGTILIFTNFLIVLLNILPIKMESSFGIIATDGLAMLQTLTATQKQIHAMQEIYYLLSANQLAEENLFEDAEEILCKGLERHPDSFPLKHNLAAMLAKQEKNKEALTIFHELKKRDFKDDWHLYLLLANIAYLNVILHYRDLNEETGHYSEVAWKNVPWMPGIGRIRGIVLIHLDCHVEGTTLLRELLHHFTESESRAETLCWIAIGEWKAENFTEARQTLYMAESLDKGCEILPRAKQLFSTQKQEIEPS